MNNDDNEKAINETAMNACIAARSVGACSGREAANITMGRELSDAEWSEFGLIWTENWDILLANETHNTSNLTDSASQSNAATTGADAGLEEELNSIVQLYKLADKDTRMGYLIRLGAIVTVTLKQLDISDADFFTFKENLGSDQVEPIKDKILMFCKVLDDQAIEDGDDEDDRAVTQIAFSTLINSILAEGRPRDILARQIEFLDRMIAIAIDLADRHAQTESR